MAKRRTWALIALAGCAGVFGHLGQRSADGAALATASTGPAAPDTSRSTLPEDLPRRHFLGASKGELFSASVAAAAPPPSSPPASAPVAPAALPNPYAFAGTSSQGGELKVWLFSGNRVYEARAGEVLDGDYRIESVGRDVVVLLHVPTNVEQRIERRP